MSISENGIEKYRKRRSLIYRRRVHESVYHIWRVCLVQLVGTGNNWRYWQPKINLLGIDMLRVRIYTKIFALLFILYNFSGSAQYFHRSYYLPTP